MLRPSFCSPSPHEISAAFRYVSGSSGPGRITCARKGDGAAAYGSEAYWLDDVGAAIQVEATGYDFCHAQDEQDRWLASFTVYGESTSSDWYSTDDALSWTRI